MKKKKKIKLSLLFSILTISICKTCCIISSSLEPSMLFHYVILLCDICDCDM